MDVPGRFDTFCIMRRGQNVAEVPETFVFCEVTMLSLEGLKSGLLSLEMVTGFKRSFPCDWTFLFDDGYLKAPLEKDDRQTTPEFAEKLGCSHTTVVKHFKSFRLTQKFRL